MFVTFPCESPYAQGKGVGKQTIFYTSTSTSVCQLVTWCLLSLGPCDLLGPKEHKPLQKLQEAECA